ncbi:MAG: hypothetical protein JXA77_18425 [Bacteroidales bacterium]|nr:hypothetical protein [Bacteroidales bacterium]MBN2818162.1 hypothetical protein [Bacteroidales bacterium]
MKKYTLLKVLTVLFCSSNSFAQADFVADSPCSCGDCQDSFGIYTWEEDEFKGNKYLGEFSKGYLNGFGIYYFNTGNIYIGEFSSNLMSGYGQHKWTNGETYIGQWYNHKRNGFGLNINANGTKNIGRYTNNVFDESSRIYEDACVSGNCENGEGVFLLMTGEQYSGSFINNSRNGYGTNIFPSGTIYRGFWINNNRSGAGLQIYNSNSDYLYFKGTYRDDLPNYGLLVYKDGRKYNGDLKNELPDGSGAMTYCNGSISEGNWVAGVYYGNSNPETINKSEAERLAEELVNYYLAEETKKNLVEYNWILYNMSYSIPNDLVVSASDKNIFSADNGTLFYSIYPRTLTIYSDIDRLNDILRWARNNQIELLYGPEKIEDNPDYIEYMISGTLDGMVVACLLMVDRLDSDQGFYIWLKFDSNLYDVDYLSFFDQLKRINK